MSNSVCIRVLLRMALFLLLAGAMRLAIAQDAFENDGTLSLAKALPLDGTIQLRDFHINGDVDWIKFQLASGASAALSPRPSTSTTSLRWRAELFEVTPAGTVAVGSPYVFGAARPTIPVTNTRGATQDYALVVRYDTTPFSGFASRYLLSAAITSGGSTTSPDAYEENNTRDTAKPLNEADGWQQHNFHVPGDHDWGAYFLGQGLTSTVTIEPVNFATENRWQVTLKTVAWNNAAGTWELVDAAPTVALGLQSASVSGAATISGGQMFWVQVRSINGTDSGSATAYRMRVVTAPTPTTATPDAYEPNDTREAGKPLQEADGWQQHNFHSGSDHDWMGYFLGDGLRSTVTVEPLTQTTTPLWQVTLKTVGRNPVTNEWELVDAAPTASFGPQGISLTGATVYAGGQMFWVHVRNTNGTHSGPASSYRIRVVTGLHAPFEPNDTRETAGALNELSGWQEHNFHHAADQDWFAYFLGEGHTGTVTVQPVTGTANPKWQITLKTVRRNPLTNEWELIDAAPTVQLGAQPGSVSGAATIAGGQMFWANVRSTDGALTGSASSYRIRTTVTASPQQSIVITATPGTNLTAPANTRLTATVSATSLVQHVEYRYLGSQICAPVTAPPYACDWNQLAAGSYEVTGIATLSTGTLNSTPITLTVAPASGPTESYVYHHTDARGSIVATTDQNGRIVALPSYRAFGRPVTTTVVQPPVPAPPINGVALGFTGKWYDAQLQLSNHGARHYDPLYSSFISIDPATVREDDSRTVARYMYANNNPIKYVDPDGRASEMAQERFADAVGRNPGAYQYMVGPAVAITGAALLATGGALAVEALYAWFGNAATANTIAATALEAGAGEALGGATLIGAGALTVRAAGEALDVAGDGVRMYGPYHRLGDSAENIASIRATGELRGNPPINTFQSDLPQVQAYDGPLPPGANGFEFITPVAPHSGSVPSSPRWYGTTPGASEVNGQAVIPCTVTRSSC